MNYEHIDIDRMVMESYYLHALDIEDRQREGSFVGYGTSGLYRHNKDSKRGT